MNININELETRMALYAETVALGGPKDWEKITYEWLGQSLIIDTIDTHNDDELYEFVIILTLADEMKSEYVKCSFVSSSGWLLTVINNLAIECRWAIEEKGAAEARSQIRGALGIIKPVRI